MKSHILRIVKQEILYVVFLSGLFAAGIVSAAQVDLVWDPAIDNVGVSGYSVLRSTVSGGPYIKIGTTSNTQYSDTQVTNGNTYYYVVQAYDAAGNVSKNSNQVIAQVPAASSDTAPPTVSILFPINDARASGTISIRVKAFDNVDVVKVEVFVDNQLVGTAVRDSQDPTLWTLTWDTTKVADGTHTLVAIATDSSGNQKSSPPITIVVANGRIITPISIGDIVMTLDNLNVRAGPSLRGTFLGVQPIGSRGVVVGGPVSQDGYIWWQIDYDNLPDGWSVEPFLVKIPLPNCGNGKIDPGEQCDGANLGGKLCISLGFSGGTLKCTSSCTLSTLQCTGPRLSCDAFKGQLTIYLDRIRNAVGGTTSQDQIAERLREVWLRYQATQLAQLSTFEANVNSVLASWEARARTDIQKQAALDFKVAVTNLLAARRDKITSAVGTYVDGVLNAIDQRKAAVTGALALRTSSLESAFNEAVNLCAEGTPQSTAQIKFYKTVSAANTNYAIALRDAGKTYAQTIRDLTVQRNLALVQANIDYRTGYLAAWEKFRQAFYAR